MSFNTIILNLYFKDIYRFFFVCIIIDESSILILEMKGVLLIKKYITPQVKGTNLLYYT